MQHSDMVKGPGSSREGEVRILRKNANDLFELI